MGRSISTARFSLSFPALALAAVLAFTPTSPAEALGENLECVPFARQLSGIDIYGDAHLWWTKAEGRYARGRQPRVGAVLAFRPYAGMRQGHVATVTDIVDRRTLRVSHANWSTIDGRRGHVEENVRVVDVSRANDWSRVRVWYTPIGALGGTRWPTYGFIYPERGHESPRATIAAARPAPVPRETRPAREPARNLLAQIGGGWVEKAAVRERAQASRHPAPARTRESRTVGYTPSANARPATGEPRSLDELLSRF